MKIVQGRSRICQSGNYFTYRIQYTYVILLAMCMNAGFEKSEISVLKQFECTVVY